MTFRVLSVTQ